MLQGTDQLHPFFGRKHPFNHPINFRQFRVEIDEAVFQDGLVQIDQVGERARPVLIGNRPQRFH